MSDVAVSTLELVPATEPIMCDGCHGRATSMVIAHEGVTVLLAMCDACHRRIAPTRELDRVDLAYRIAVVLTRAGHRVDVGVAEQVVAMLEQHGDLADDTATSAR